MQPNLPEQGQEEGCAHQGQHLVTRCSEMSVLLLSSGSGRLGGAPHVQQGSRAAWGTARCCWVCIDRGPEQGLKPNVLQRDCSDAHGEANTNSCRHCRAELRSTLPL